MTVHYGRNQFYNTGPKCESLTLISAAGMRGTTVKKFVFLLKNFILSFFIFRKCPKIVMFIILSSQTMFFVCFTSDHQTCYSLFLGQTCHGCIKHDMVEGPCFKLLMWLSYYQSNIRIKFRLLQVLNPGPLGPEWYALSILPRRQPFVISSFFVFIK